ncbi:MAG: hypothetical protein Q4D04_09705 [Clostridia bacterium]|nr:hypothetical protein [Clostridia bacterium]
MTFNPFDAGAGIIVVVGHYGSGKTEISLRLALMAAGLGERTTLVDLDIVNPFFRSAEKLDLMAESGVEMVCPPYALTGVDLPVLSAQVDACFDRPGVKIFDVGGDDAGAAALGRFKPRFDAFRHEMYYVVNAFRPFSRKPCQVIEMMSRVQARSRLNITAMINNSNLGDETTAQDVLSGQKLLDEVTEATGIKTLCACCLTRVRAGLPADMPVITMERLLKPEWMM